MTEEEFRNLGEGDIIRHKSDYWRHRPDPVMVMGNYGKGIIVGRIQLIHNPIEWDLVSEAKRESPV